MKYTSKLVLSITLLSQVLSAQPSYPTNPENAELIYTDVEHFVEAYEKLNAECDTVAVLKQYYFDRGSNGLREFIIRHKLAPEMLKNAIAKNSDKYAKIEEFLAAKTAFQMEFKKTMHLYNGVLPSAMYPPTYLMVGANRGIGQASKVGQLITITRVIDRPDTLKKLIVHELSHFQQALTMGVQQYGALYSKSNNMLELCLREGGAEFVTSLVLDEITHSKELKYLESNESELKKKFREDLSKQDTKFWLWDSIDNTDTPHLLGYVMGYKICSAYYQNKPDKQQALKDILLMEEAEKFKEDSGYFK